MVQWIKKITYALVLIAVLVVAGVVYLAINSNSVPVVAAGDTVSVYYTGTLANGTKFDSNVGKQPLQFTVGANEVIAGFQRAVISMKLNQTKTIALALGEAYGEVNSKMIIPVPLAEFGNQTVQTGMVVTQSSGGQQLQGTVTSVNSTTATVDFNPPLAGKTLSSTSEW